MNELNLLISKITEFDNNDMPLIFHEDDIIELINLLKDNGVNFNQVTSNFNNPIS